MAPRKSKKKVKSSITPPIEIFTDGSCFPHNSAGGWAGVIEYPDGKKSVVSGRDAKATNNTMELTAVIKSVAAIETPSKIVIKSDSQYVVFGAEKWLPNWLRKGFKTSTGKPVANQGLWKEINDIKKKHDIKFVHVPAHCDNSPRGNVIADLLARDEACLVE